MNQLIRHIKHEMANGSSDQQTTALQMFLVSMVCLGKGEFIKKFIKLAKICNYNEVDALSLFLNTLEDDEHDRIMKLWKNYNKEKENADE